MEYMLYFDVETQKLAADVPGGWNNIPAMDVSVVCAYHSADEKFYTFYNDGMNKADTDIIEEKLPHAQPMMKLIHMFDEASLVIGHNTLRFDYTVLTPFEEAAQWMVNKDFLFKNLPSFDLLVELKKKLGFRVSLDSLAEATFGDKKTGDGLDAVRWWKEGRQVERIEKYCIQDVKLTRDVFMFACKNGYLKYTSKYKDKEQKIYTVDTSNWMGLVKQRMRRAD